jgi:hypothetical protein
MAKSSTKQPLPPQAGEPPTFQIPIGRHRQNGAVVMFEDDDPDQDAVMDQWNELVFNHPATLAAGGCVIIGPTTTTYVDLRSGIATQSETEDGAWQPSALSDWQRS